MMKKKRKRVVGTKRGRRGEKKKKGKGEGKNGKMKEKRMEKGKKRMEKGKKKGMMYKYLLSDGLLLNDTP